MLDREAGGIIPSFGSVPFCAHFFCTLAMVKEAKHGRRAHACPRCDSTFADPSKLTTHVRTVHEKRRDHACPHCAAAFTQAGNLKTHVRTQHPDTTRRTQRVPTSWAAAAPIIS